MLCTPWQVSPLQPLTEAEVDDEIQAKADAYYEDMSLENHRPES
jgi:hypothetical protein